MELAQATELSLFPRRKGEESSAESQGHPTPLAQCPPFASSHQLCHNSVSTLLDRGPSFFCTSQWPTLFYNLQSGEFFIRLWPRGPG